MGVLVIVMTEFMSEYMPEVMDIFLGTRRYQGIVNCEANRCPA